jgi:hypothetical protein
VPSAFPHGPADRTGRFLERIGADPARAAAAADVHVELVAEHLDPATEIALALTATLLLRMADYAPTVHLLTPRGRTIALPLLADTPLSEALATAHAGFASQDRLVATPAERCDLRLVFSGNRDGLAVSTHGWAVALGERLPGTGNALAAAYAGALAAAEALKVLLGPLGGAGTGRRPWRGVVSLWDYAMSPTAGPPLEAVDLGTAAWVGAGGVASAAAWSLAALSAQGTDLTGSGIVVDHDLIDPDGTNLNRHLTALMSDRGTAKARLLADLLAPAGITLGTREKRWEAIAPDERHPAVCVVSVDDDAVRRAVQFDMPAVVLNAGTGDTGQYQTTVHNLLDGACLACISLADKTIAGPEHALADRLGISIADLRPHLRSHDPLPAHLLAGSRLTARDREQAATIAGRDLLEHFCGSLRLEQGPAVSIPMLSAAAGILLAAELVKSAIPDADSPPGQVVRTNILTGPHRRWRSQRGKVPDCPCQDELYRDYYRAQWPQ